MGIVIGTTSIGYPGSFGEISNDRANNVTIESASNLRQELFLWTQKAASENKLNAVEPDNDYLEKVDRFRAELGVLWLKLEKELNSDISKAHLVLDNFWKCMWFSIVSRKLRSQKYRALCGTNYDGYGALVTYLANVLWQDELVKHWKVQSWKAFVDQIWLTKNRLIEKEKEYRDLSIAIAQIGMGFGGMGLGFIGLLLSIIISFTGAHSNTQHLTHISTVATAPAP